MYINYYLFVIFNLYFKHNIKNLKRVHEHHVGTFYMHDTQYYVKSAITLEHFHIPTSCVNKIKI